jgi:hypothetical protein
VDAIGEVRAPAPIFGKKSVVVIELIDMAGERAEVELPWTTAPNYTKLRDRPIAIAREIYPR